MFFLGCLGTAKNHYIGNVKKIIVVMKKIIYKCYFLFLKNTVYMGCDIVKLGENTVLGENLPKSAILDGELSTLLCNRQLNATLRITEMLLS